MDTARKRSSNFELLRILAIYLIVVFHGVFGQFHEMDTSFGFNTLLIKTFWMFGELGVNLFALLTGYFLITSSFKWKKLLRMAVEVWTYNCLTLFVALQIGAYRPESQRDLLKSMLPFTTNHYWYPTAYLILYIFSPYLSLLVQKMDKKMFQSFLCKALLIYSVIPTVLGVLTTTNTTESESLFFYTRMLWLMIVYCLGAYIRKYGLPIIKDLKAAAGTSMAAFAILVASVVVICRYYDFFQKLNIQEIAYFWRPNTVPLLLLSVGVFGLFMNLQISYHPLINRCASTTLGVYMLHDGWLSKWSRNAILPFHPYRNSPWLGARILLWGGVYHGYRYNSGSYSPMAGKAYPAISAGQAVA